MVKAFEEIRSEARANIIALKEASPYIFAEYSELKQAERDLAAAKRRYEAARFAWSQLGVK